MKKTLKTIISFVSIALLVLSFSSCSIFQAMRENAMNADKIVIHDSPEAEKLITQFNEMLAASKAEAIEIKENIGYSAGTPEVLKDGSEAGILDSAAGQLKNFIMSANPGSQSNVIEKDASSLLNALDEAFVLNYTFSRNMVTENVTDAEGAEVTDADGNIVTEDRISDNCLHLTFEFFDVTAADGTEYETNENGEVEEETTVVFAEDATIEAVFGTLKDKADVLKNFENVKDYITVSDYEVDYNKCTITSDADLETGRLSFVRFQKEMTVTAQAEGVGALSEYGKLEVVFNLTQTVTYEFTYEEEAEDSEETTGTEEATAEETTVAEETTAIEETTAAIEETTVADEDTTATAEETTAA